MKKAKLLTLSLGALLGLTACGGNRIVHEVNQELADVLPTSEITIKFWHCLGQEKAKNLKKVIDKFNAKYKGSYFLDDSGSPGSATYDSLHEGIKTNISSGNVPALAIGYPDSFAEYMGTREDGSNILRLNNFIFDTRTISVNQVEYDEDSQTWVVKKDEHDNPVKEDIPLGIPEEEWNDFVTAYRDEGKGYQFEGYWSLPMYKSTEVMFYNLEYFMGYSDLNDETIGTNSSQVTYEVEEGVEKKVVIKDYYWDLVDAYKALGKYYSSNHDEKVKALNAINKFVTFVEGYTYEVPVKWDDMVNLAQDMKDDRIEVFGQTQVQNENFIPVGYDSDSNLMISQMAQRGIPYTTNENINVKSDHILFNNEQAKDLLREIGGLIDNKLLCTKYSIDQTGQTYTNKYFTAAEGAGGRCVMSIGSTGGATYQVTDDFAVEVAPVPYYGETPQYIQQGPSVCFFDNNNSKEINTGAWLFYKMLTDVESNTGLATENDYDPVKKKCLETTTYDNWIKGAKLELLHHVPEITHLPQVYNNQMTSPVFVGSSKCRTEIGNLIKVYVHQRSTSIDQNFQDRFDSANSATRK